jgi:hypothetical protein
MRHAAVRKAMAEPKRAWAAASHSRGSRHHSPLALCSATHYCRWRVNSSRGSSHSVTPTKIIMRHAVVRKAMAKPKRAWAAASYSSGRRHHSILALRPATHRCRWRVNSSRGSLKVAPRSSPRLASHKPMHAVQKYDAAPVPPLRMRRTQPRHPVAGHVLHCRICARRTSWLHIGHAATAMRAGGQGEQPISFKPAGSPHRAALTLARCSSGSISWRASFAAPCAMPFTLAYRPQAAARATSA